MKDSYDHHCCCLHALMGNKLTATSHRVQAQTSWEITIIVRFFTDRRRARRRRGGETGVVEWSAEVSLRGWTRRGMARRWAWCTAARHAFQSKTTTGPAPGSRVAVVSGCPLSSHPGLTGGGARGRAAFALCLRRRVARGRRVPRRRTGLVVRPPSKIW